MLKYLKSLFGGKSTPEFSVEMCSSPRESTKWDEISEMEIPSSEKIKLVKVQRVPVEEGQTLESKRKSKKYTITVTPQEQGCFEHDESRKIAVYVLAGSKEEALETLSNKLSGKYPYYGDSNTNSAIAGRWYDGNRYLLDITHFEKSTRNT